MACSILKVQNTTKKFLSDWMIKKKWGCEVVRNFLQINRLKMTLNQTWEATFEFQTKLNLPLY